ncbi:MAG: DsrE family protein [Casimicrobiaceae bacterium]
MIRRPAVESSYAELLSASTCPVIYTLVADLHEGSPLREHIHVAARKAQNRKRRGPHPCPLSRLISFLFKEDFMLHRRLHAPESARRAGILAPIIVAASIALAPVAASAQADTAPASATQGDRVVYHINDAQAQALGALRNIRNHLDVDPKARITVVAHALGVDFLMEGTKDRNGNAFAPTVQALKNRGVRFEVCEITLKNRNLKKEQFIPEADFTPSGVARITQLQTREGAAYIRP